MTGPLRGGRFIHEIRAQWTQGAAEVVSSVTRFASQADVISRHITGLLDDPETKRIIFDSRQAAVFAQTGNLPPIAGRLRCPFDQMYVEFSEPVIISEQEPGLEEDAIALLIVKSDTMIHRADELAHPVVTVTVLFRESDGKTYADRTFTLDLVTGYGLCRIGSCTDDTFGPDEASVFPPESAALSPEQWIAARTEGEGVGFWERQVRDLASFASWMLAYMTARGVVIVEERLPTRQQRRALARMKHRPQPWHFVYVKPVHVQDNEADGAGSVHGYRYDVRGHLRLGRHRLADGSYREHIEWVRPHQRGLAHMLYIPKTYVYDKDKSGPRLREDE